MSRLILLLLCLLPYVLSFSPYSPICDVSNVPIPPPSHPPTLSASTTSTITVSSTTYTPGVPLTVTVKGQSNGLVLYGRTANGDHVGTFTIPTQLSTLVQILNCSTAFAGVNNDRSTLGHSQNIAKTNAAFQWMPPATAMGAITFQGMFTAGTKEVYQLANVVITPAGAATTQAPTPSPAVPTGPTTPAPTAAPATGPNPPTSVVAEAGNAVITIAYVPPRDNGGSPITSYTATCISPAPCTIKPVTVAAATTPTPFFITVTNGVKYIFSVVAVNALGTSTAVQTNPVIATATASVPSPPTNIQVVPTTSGNAWVSWTLPASSGGSYVSGYIVSAYPATNGAQLVSQVNTIMMSATITGLIPGMSYQFSVVAVNKNGMSTPAQTTTNVMIPVQGATLLPVVVTGLFATGFDRTARLTWDAPKQTGILSYTIRNDKGQMMNVTGQPVTFDRLQNFVPYAFSIAAWNVAGLGPFSTWSNVVVPAALSPIGAPGSPTNVMATHTAGAVTVTWTAGKTGTTATTMYWIIASSGQNMSVSALTTAAGVATQGTFAAGVLPTSTVSFVVVAANTLGTSQPSMLSTPVDVVNPFQMMAPDNPFITDVQVSLDGTMITVSFVPPTNTGNSPILSYTAFTNDMQAKVTGPSSPLILTNVLIGPNTVVFVSATNAIGTSMPDPAAGAPIPMPAMPTMAPTMTQNNVSAGFTMRGFSTTWKINPDQTITFTMTGQCTGYISIGFAGGPLMANNADYYTGYIDDATQAFVFKDTFSTSRLAPKIDDRQDIISSTGTQVNGVTSITFTRKLDTGDTAEDFAITNTAIYVHWAIANSDDLISYHTDRGVKMANLFTGQTAAVAVTNMNAAYLLCINALSIFLWYALIRWSRKMLKSCRHSRHIKTLQKQSSESSTIVPYNTLEHSKSQSSLNSQQAMMRAQATSLSQYHARISGADEIQAERTMQSNPLTDAWGATSSVSSHKNSDNSDIKHRRMQTSMGPSPINANSQQQRNWEAQWQALQTEEGWTYYYNEKTQETSWEIPPMPDYFEGRGARYSIAPQATRDGVNVDNIKVEVPTQRSAIPPTAAAARYAIAKKSNHSFLAQLYAIFQYRIPRTQHSVNQILVFVIYLILNMVALFAVDTKNDMATRWGWLATGNMLLVALPATRNSVLIWVLGYSFDVVMVFHRWIGRFLFIAVSAHMFGWYFMWHQQGLSIYMMQFSNISYQRGFYAWLALLIVEILSLEFFRRRHFEFFYHTHFTFFVFYALAYLHKPTQSPYFLITLVIYLLDRAVRTFWGIIPRKTTLLQAKGGDILQVRFPKHPLAHAAKLYKVGQYVFVNFPQLSLVQWHPFSISSAPDERTAEIHIRSLGDYTRAMLQKVKANKQQEMWIRVDGPYGSHRLTYHRYPVLILVGGGIGITPIISILKDIYHVGDFDRNATPKVNSIEGICCVWVIPNQATYEWFADEFEKLVAASQNPMMPPLFLWVYVTRDNNMGPNSNFVSGKPDFDHIFACAAKDYRNKATCVFACGPELMVSQAWDASNARKRAGDTFTFHHETFEW